MQQDSLRHHSGVLAALGSAALFGLGTPLAKLLLQDISPWLLAGLLYLGSGLGLGLYRRVRRTPNVVLTGKDGYWLAAAVLCGGVLGPLLLMLGLRDMPASGASLLLNAEGLFTALLAWFLFKENVDRRVALGMFAILAGAVLLAWPHQLSFAGMQPALAILAACLAWGLDNNLTRKLALTDATWIAAVKGLAAGSVNLALAMSLGANLPPLANLLGAALVGFFCYGVSLVLFVVGLRQLGTARTGAYFSTAPFIGALVAVALGDSITIPMLVAGALMALGIWLHLTERHEHSHQHEFLEHTHEHVHDEHHQHTHATPVPAGTRHSHPHQHQPMTHSHPHYPDAHHRHGH